MNKNAKRSIYGILNRLKMPVLTGAYLRNLSWIQQKVMLTLLPAMLIMSIVSTGSVSAACIPPPTGMISWWTGDSTADDLLGSNNGALQNGATYAPGLVGDAYSFNDKTSAYVSVPDSPSLDVGTGDFSMDTWIKTNSTKDINTIQAKQSRPGIAIGYSVFIAPGGLGPGVQFGNAPLLI